MCLEFYTRAMNPDDVKTLRRLETIEQLISYAADQFEQQKAFVYKSGEETRFITYKQLRERVASAAEHFSACSRVAIIASPCHEWMEAFLGIACAGKAAVLLPASIPPQAVIGLSAASGADGIVYGPEFEDAAKAAAEKLGMKLCAPIESLFSGGEDFALRGVSPDALAAILFTSGTTGANKCVPLSQGNIMANAYNGILGVPVHRGDRCLAVLPLHHVFGMNRSVISILYEGGEVYINENMKAFFPNLAWARPTTLVLVPALAEALGMMMVKSGKEVAGGALKTVITGGSAMKPKTKALYKTFGINLLQGYGLTECAMISGNTETESHFDSVGKPYPGNEVKIVDGEIWVRGKSVFSGYFNPAENAEVFEDGWFKTGDLGRIDEEGFLYITGRKKFVIITESGENVSPEELEALIGDIREIEESMVFEAAGKNGQKALGVELYAPSSDEAACRERILALNRTLPLYKQIQVIAMRNEPFPKNAANKMIRKAPGL